MKQNYRKLPVGVENFEEIRKENFYYVDKTHLIEKLLQDRGKANLFTRPRRFGKSLNMSMLKSFFEVGSDPDIFDGLYIAHNHELCEEYMGKYPVISISLKGIDASDFSIARSMAVSVICEEAKRFQFLLDSSELTLIDKNDYMKLVQDDMSEQTLRTGLKELSRLLHKHYGKKVIVLIDEYDVPLAKANEFGFYDQMVDLLRSIFGNVLKTNDHMYFAVLTGCLRVAKESIFTGLNTFNVDSVIDVDYEEDFGFTDEEVKLLLEYYGQMEHYNIVKEWYDGYHFGNVDVYCPWDVINYVKSHISDPQMPPRNYWLHTSGNDIIKHFIDDMGKNGQITKTELEDLVNGKSVQKIISQEVTYKELYDSAENIWSTLFMTGYLTQRGKAEGNLYELVIPNNEIRNIITEHILTMFKSNIKDDGVMLQNFCNALENGDAEKVESIFTDYMKKTISVRDTFVKKATKENFYHGILLGILGFKSGWRVNSNKEAGDGFSDILIRIDDSDVGIVIEVKYSENGTGDIECRKAITQIDQKKYVDEFRDNGIGTIWKYGIVCNKKKCRVLVERD